MGHDGGQIMKQIKPKPNIIVERLETNLKLEPGQLGECTNYLNLKFMNLKKITQLNTMAILP